jgi:hypothetical protein
MEMSRLAVLLLGATVGSAAFAQNATTGYWPLPDTKFGGYFSALAVQPDGSVKGNNPSTVETGSPAVLKYEFAVSKSSPNFGMASNEDMCRKIAAELIKNERSVLRYFHKAPPASLKPVPVPAGVDADFTQSGPKFITKAVGGTTVSHTRCYVRSHKLSTSPDWFMVIGTYQK